MRHSPFFRRMSIVTRFAPSPTGYLHLGHAHTALTAWRRARQISGKFRLRIEDIDQGRCRPDFTEAIKHDLTWLGIDWDGPVRVQSEHFDEYRAVLANLAARDLVYPCFCTRVEIAREIERAGGAPQARDGGRLYPGTCRRHSADERAARLASGQAYALRLDVGRALATIVGTLSFEEEREGRRECRPEQFGDVVLGRKETPASYHLCVAHDDARQGVTLVTRGVDLKSATDLHRLIQALMNWPAPTYAHHRLLKNAEGARLAKRDGAASLRLLRAQGCSAAKVRALAGFPD